MKSLIILSLCLQPWLSSGQWFNLGEIGHPSRIAIASEDTIYSFSNTYLTPSSGTIGYVYGHGELLFQTPNHFGCCPIQDLFFIDKDTGFLIYTDQTAGVILQTNNGGNSWGSSYCNAIGWNEDDFQYLTRKVGYSIFGFFDLDQGFFKRCINGSSYDTNFTNYHFNINSKVCFADVNTGFILGSDSNHNPIVIRSADQGTSWNPVLANNGLAFNCIYFPSSNIGFIAGGGGRVYKTNDKGATWIESIINPGVIWNDIFFINDSCGFVVGTQANVYYTSDAGGNWVKQQIPTYNDLIRVVFVSDSTGFICSYTGYHPDFGEMGELFKTENRGALGINDSITEISYKLTVFPNPNSGTFSILVPAEFTNEKSLQVEVLDNAGKSVYIQQVPISKKIIHLTFNNIAKGIYCIKLSDGDHSYNTQIVKE
ncbi:MAG: T9SS type A sorting domain-containing protein [bacterium]